MYVIEVKEGNPNISIVKEKIQYCLDVMIGLLPNPKNQFAIIPVLCALNLSGLKNRALLSYRVRIRGHGSLIHTRNHGQDINQL